MALSKTQKNEIIDKVSELLQSSKMTVVAKYEGTTVSAMQALRRQAKENGTNVKVIKNRLLIKAIKDNKALQNLDTSLLKGMLVYAFNDQDEVAPAQKLAEFAKTNPTLQFVGAISQDGAFLGADQVKDLAALPSKDQLIGQVISTLLAPLNDSISGLSGNLHGLLDGVAEKAAN